MLLLEILLFNTERLEKVTESDKNILLEIAKIPPFELLEDIILYKYHKNHKILLWKKINNQKHWKWIKKLSIGLNDEKINEILKKIL